MARNIELVVRCFRLTEEVATELTKLVFGEPSTNAEALAKFSTFDKEIIDTFRESIDPEWKKVKEEVKKPLEENKEVKEEVVEKKETMENSDNIDAMLDKVIFPFRFQKEEVKKPLEENKEVKEEVKKEIGKFSNKIEKELEALKAIDPALEKCVSNIKEFFRDEIKNMEEAVVIEKEEVKKPLEEKEEVIEEAVVVEEKKAQPVEEKKAQPVEEKKELDQKKEFKPVTPEEVTTVLGNIIRESITNLPDQVNEYLKGVFEGIQKLDFSKIKSDAGFDKRINTTLTKLAEPIAEIIDAAGFICNKELLKEQFYKTADGVKAPITLTKKFVYNPNFSIRRIANGYSLDASEMKEFRNDLTQCIEGMEFANVDEFKTKVMDNHEQVFAPVYAKYNLQEDLAYSYDHSKDNPFELEISLKDSEEESFVVGEEVSPEELNDQINAVLNTGAGEVVVTKRNWKRKETTKK